MSRSTSRARDTTVYGYVDNWGGTKRRVEPCVHILTTDHRGETQSILFKPKLARKVAEAMLDAADVVEEARKDYYYSPTDEPNDVPGFG
jgi:hypothetical protein